VVDATTPAGNRRIRDRGRTEYVIVEYLQPTKFFGVQSIQPNQADMNQPAHVDTAQQNGLRPTPYG
jgi:hypothetical protein